jgi:hypothetical protein
MNGAATEIQVFHHPGANALATTGTANFGTEVDQALNPYAEPISAIILAHLTAAFYGVRAAKGVANLIRGWRSSGGTSDTSGGEG